MKKQTKVFAAILGLGASVVMLSSCTASFCSVEDKSQMMYAYDVYKVIDTDTKTVEMLHYDATESREAEDVIYRTFGISKYYEAGSQPSEAVLLDGFNDIYVTYDISTNLALVKINSTAISGNIRVNDYIEFWSRIDNYFLEMAIEAAQADGMYNTDKATMNYRDIKEVLIGNEENQTKGYGYLKYCGLNAKNKQAYWANFDEAYLTISAELGQDKCPNSDFIKQYKSSMVSYGGSTVSCIATKNGFYGYYGYNSENKIAVFISSKSYSYGWNKGFLEGLLIYPISWLIDNIGAGIAPGLGGITNGWAQLLAIVIVTFMIRAIMMLITIKQTTSQSKMSELQPEIAKIQQKYPNANSNKYEQQQMAMEQQALYKKHGVNPFLSIITLFIQFPVFICVWGAMNGSAILSSGTLLGLRLNTSVSSVVTTWSNWPAGTGLWTAIVLFLVMAGLQIVAMLLPQYINKKKQAKVTKTAVNNNAKKQGNTMKWVTVIMVGMIIIMGFTLASGMVLYWIAGSLWAIAQTLIIELINKIKNKNKNSGNKRPVRTHVSADGENFEAEVLPEYMAAPTGKKKKYKGN